MFKPLISGLAATGLVVSGLVVSAPQATAAGSCSMYIPSRVAVSQPYRAITARLAQNCVSAGVTWANWDGYHFSQGLQEFLIFDGTTTDIWNLYDDFTPLGPWSWRPEGAYDANFDTVYQFGPYSTDVRLGSYSRISAVRSGSRVTLSTLAGRYFPAADTFYGWAGARGQIQYREPGWTSWHGLKEVYSSSTGRYSYTYTTSRSRYYRVVIRPVGTVWGSTSPVIYK
jgi:hypothetical protein